MHTLFGLIFYVAAFAGVLASLGGVATFQDRKSTDADMITMGLINLASVVFAIIATLLI